VADLPDRSGPPARSPQLRVSDADREQVAEVLRQAAGDGRLTMDELDERLSSAYAARTFADLAPLTNDLPATTAVPGAAPAGHWSGVPSRRIGGTPTSRIGIAILGGFSRRGRWVAPRHFTAVTVLGGGSIDLRDAEFSEPELTIHAYTLMGGIDITVPEDVEVVVHGVPIMGGVDGPGGGSGHPPPPGAAKVTVVAVALLGGIEVKVKAPKDPMRKKQRKLPR
jgi:Domain of unknown function (DUF1707)/Cell wall-active antibiotics response 4TMS YvqF